MRNNSFRIRYATGPFSLPIMAGITGLLWMLPDFSNLNLWAGLCVTGIVTYFLMELNNRNALIRIRSRMVSCTFLTFILSIPAFHSWSTDMIPMLCLTLSYLPLFATYQNPHPERLVFQSFLCLGCASWFYPPLLICALILYICLLIPLRALTWRGWFAGLFGIVVPYWFYTGWAIWNECLDTAFLPIIATFQFSSPDYSAVPTGMLVSNGFFTILALLAMLHYYRTAYNDKIRTRMFYYVIICVECFILAALYLQPQNYHILSYLLTVNSAPLIAHYFALSKNRIMNYWFILCFAILGAITFINYFDLWTLLSKF